MGNSYPIFLEIYNYLPCPVWIEMTGQSEGKCILPIHLLSLDLDELYVVPPTSKIIVKLFVKNKEGNMVQLVPDQRWKNVASFYGGVYKGIKNWRFFLTSDWVMKRVNPELKEELQEAIDKMEKERKEEEEKRKKEQEKRRKLEQERRKVSEEENKKYEDAERIKQEKFEKEEKEMREAMKKLNY